jgi:hypothetical protein
MGKRWQMLFGVGAGMLVAGYSLTTLVGCSDAPAASSRPSAAQLKEGLNILQASDPSFGLSAAYLQKGRVVYLETRVGALMPEVYRNDAPTAPKNEMDLRVVDQDNHTVYAMRGGDSFVDPTWATDYTASRHLPPSAYANRATDWTLAKTAAGALAAGAPAGFEDHVYHIAHFAAAPTPQDDPRMAERSQNIAMKPPGEADVLANKTAIDGTQYGTYTYGQWSVFDTEKYSKGLVCVCVFWGCACAASHSATEMWDYEGYYTSPPTGGSWEPIGWVVALSACNHGPCWNNTSVDPPMGYDCQTSSNWYYNTGFNGETTTNLTGAGDGTGGCQTAYNWDSGIGSHLCNDDAAYELFQSANHPNYPNSSFAVYNQGSHCDGDLCGQSPSNYSCGYSGSLSGDWNTPNCQSTNF